MTTLKEVIYAKLCHAANAGERCPTRYDLERLRNVSGISGNIQKAIRDLVAEGAIVMEVYAKNWRVCVILNPNGYEVMRTAKCPWSEKPYLVSRKKWSKVCL